jgi:6-phosphogluconolactonase
MASGTIAPFSTSKGPGLDVAIHEFQYQGEANAQVVVYATAKNAAAGLAKSVTEAAAAAIKAKGSFTLVLSGALGACIAGMGRQAPPAAGSRLGTRGLAVYTAPPSPDHRHTVTCLPPGGSLINMLSSVAEAKGVDFSKWWVFWVDERNVPHDSPDSNYKGCQEALLGRVGIPAEQVFAIQEGLPVKQAAVNYEGRLLGLPPSVLPRTPDSLPVFDLILLGIGPDGHVASLFPNRPETAATSGWVLPVSNSPKPPPERITFTMPAINAAKEVVVVAVGDSKAEIVQRVLEVQALPGALPAQMVRPSAGKLKWVLDSFSAQELRLEDWEAGGKAFPRNV